MSSSGFSFTVKVWLSPVSKNPTLMSVPAAAGGAWIFRDRFALGGQHKIVGEWQF